MKVLLLGKEGQLGSELQRTLLPLGFVIAVGRNDLDLQNLAGLQHLLEIHRPDLIVNAAAYTAVDKAESDRETAFLINEEVVRILSVYTRRNNCFLIHYSTDYVFDGNKAGAYVETDAVNPLSVYGASKTAGEQAILDSGCNYLIFRTSWVYSLNGKNFINTILRLAKEKKSLQIVADQVGAPTSTELIADVTALSIIASRNQCLDNGIYHLVSTGSTTWYDLACSVVDKVLDKGMALTLQRENIYPVSTEDWPLPASRPRNSKLDNAILSKSLGIYIPDWSVYVDRMIQQVTRLEFSFGCRQILQ